MSFLNMCILDFHRCLRELKSGFHNFREKFSCSLSLGFIKLIACAVFDIFFSLRAGLYVGHQDYRIIHGASIYEAECR